MTTPRFHPGQVVVCAMLLILLGSSRSDADQPEGKGKDKDKPAQSQGGGREEAPGQQADRTPPGQERSAEAAANRVERAEAKAENRVDRADVQGRADAIDRGNAAETNTDRRHPHQERSTLDRADRGTETQDERRTDRAVDHRRNREDHGREAARQRVASLLDSLNRLDRARWSFNPHDTRGQGNMGQPRMRDPYGFDKDSGREKSERGRPIRGDTEPVVEEPPAVEEPVQETVEPVAEPTMPTEPESTEAALEEFAAIVENLLTAPSTLLSLEQLVSVNFQITDSWLTQVQTALAWFYQNNTTDQDDTSIKFMEDYLARLNTLGSDSDVLIRTNFPDTVNYTLTLGTQAGLEGTNLVVTTSLVSVNNYDYTPWTFNTETGRYESTTIHYEAGQVVVQDTQQLTIGQNSTYTYSYDAPDGLVGYYENGNLFQLAVTVTEPVSGTSYTTTYDRQIYYYRCPYGIIYDKTTGKPVVGAVVTVHNADGSIAVLDKGANPNVSNPQTTDATGRYNCKLAIGKKYYLSVKAPGYAPYRSGLFSERWHIVREDVGMTPVSQQPAASVDTPLPVPVGSLGSAELGASGLSPTALPAK